ncbi:MAG TPA: GntR family transcriptional regulator [Burkholderiaceae bacterium]|nr:GntR family transcriptional regulator [Burkholderiaceae bacterium]
MLTLEAPKASSLRGASYGGLPSAGRRTEADRVYDDIFDAVMDRRLLPGTKLTEATLCAIFSCSRAVVRSALSQLAHDRIVVIEPNRGAFVWQPSSKETRDVFQMRRALECMVIDLLLAMSDLQARLAPLYDMVDHERKAFERGDRVSWLRLSNAFHVEMARLLDNDVLTAMLQSLCARTTLIIAYYDTFDVSAPDTAMAGVATPGTTACSYSEHQDILEKLARRDAEGAKAAMQHHLEDCERRMNEPEKGPVNPWLAFSVKR